MSGGSSTSLFTPRGHYTRNADLKRYFVAMSVLGQSAFCLPGTIGCRGLEAARLAILASRALAGNPDLVALWRELYEPTAFLVGLADDYTPLEVAAAARAWPPGLETRPSSRTAAERNETMTSRRRPYHQPDRAAIRFMGTRFVLDQFIFDQLLYPDVGTEEKQSLTPSSLDLAAAFGSDFAYGVVEQMGDTEYANYDAEIEAIRKAVATRPPVDWGSTVYDAWLHALEPSFVARGEAFPDFMRTDAWTAKAHQTGFGSYAELKHDTILYTKQAVAGGRRPGDPPRRNWVEPEPSPARLRGRRRLMRRDCRRGLLRRSRRAARTGIELFRFSSGSPDELAGRPISKRDNDRLMHLGGGSSRSTGEPPTARVRRGTGRWRRVVPTSRAAKGIPM